MAYAHFDTSPVTVEYQFDWPTHTAVPIVYLNDIEIFRGESESSYGDLNDTDAVKVKWQQLWEEFQAESFKEWLRVKEEEEA